MPDNRYYYFKDAKGNRHTVNKAAFDNDREGFAKAFPGARMEVIDRKTGRRGDVDVKDAGRVGDFGAHLFTGQTVRREKYQPKTSLGKAALRVAQEKWGKEESGAEPGYASLGITEPLGNEPHGASLGLTKPLAEGGKESALVKGLREADALKRRDEEQMPIDYTKPSAVKQMVGRTHREQQTLDRRMEQAGREAGKEVMKPLREKEARLKTPVVDTGDANINAHVINTQEQAERQLAESGLEFANKHLDDYVSDNILNEFKTATAKGAAAESALSKASPFAYMAAGKAYNEALDPDKLLKHLQEKANEDIAKVLSQPKMQEEIGLKAAAYGISPEEYVEKSLIPGLQAKLAADFDKSELSRSMPKSTAEYILRGVNESMLGTIMSMGMTSKKQRQYAQQGMAMTDNGENPDVNPGMAARVARGTLGFVADAPVFGAAGKAGAAVAGKVFGNGVAQTARIANSTLGGRIARMAGSGMVSQGITGVLYGSTNAAVQNYSTGDDTSIGNTVKVMAMGGLSEGASWATMGGIGGAVGAGIYNVSGVKRIPAKAFQLAMEGIGMHIGGNVAKTIEGHDTDWTSIEGNLEACANVVALKLTHARLPKRQSKDGIKESYLDMVARNINGLMTSDGQRAAFGGYTFTNEEKEQLFGSASAPKRNESIYGYDAHNNPLTRKESLTSWAMRAKKTAAKGKGEESYKDTDAEFVKTAYDEIMADNTIPWDTKAKFSALVMGTVPSARPMMENCRIEGGSVNEYSKNGELLSKNSFKSIDERNSIIYSLNMKREDQRLSNAYGAAQIKDEKTAQATLEAVAEANGMTAERLKAAMDKQPLRRSDEEQNACVALRKAYEDEQFVPGTLHAEQSNTEGKDVVEENGLGTETPNNEAASEVLGDLTKTEDALQAAMDSNDVLKEEYERMQKDGMSNPQIYMELFNSGLTQEQLAPLADYINTLSKAQGMFKGTQDKIVETTQKHVGQWSYKGELNGEKQNGEQMVFVKDDKGRVLIVGAGDVAFDGEGRVRDGDMLTVYDPATREMDFVHAKDVTLERTASSEEYAKDYQRQLEELNSTVYAEMQQQDGKPNEASLSQTKPGEQPVGEEGNEASLGLSKPTKPLGEKETTPVGEKETTPVGEESVATFADGTPVPMMKDSKGRETADYSQMSPEQGAEWMSSQFGENAEAAVDGQIKRAEKTLKDAEKIKVDYTGDLNDAKEAEAQKTMAVDAAKKELELYTNIKKAMTEKKVKAGMEKVSSVGGVGEVGSVGGVGVAREKFESGLRVVGNKRTRTLADGSKLRGHYEIVDADSLTPSHNANDGYKKGEGFPVNEEGRTINDRDYENDKQAQLVTDMIAMKYDGQAVDQVPVVTSDGIVVDGNGRTMAGQKAAKNGTDSAYLEALKENAENYGFTAEQIEQSGIKHPRLVLVSDEPMKYDTATFAKFNKNEKKAQGNTQQAVANSKKLSTDEIGTIISEIEGSGSLDAFFNNPSAINSLLTRLVDKGVIGLNEVAGLREGEDKLSAAGKDFVKNLLLGSVFSENTIRMMGADAMLKTKALNGIRAVTDNMKLGDYALMKEIDQAVQLLYEARQGGSGVDAYLRTPAMFGENAADRYDPISQAIALALEGKAEDFRELMMAYNRNAAPYADASQTEMFGERPTKEDFVNEFLKLRNWKDYETRHSSKEGNGDAGSSEGTEPQARGGSEPTEGEGLGSRGNTGQGENIDVRPAKKDSGTHVKNTEGESGNVGLGSTDKGSRNNEGQREVDKAEEGKSDKPHEASLSLTEPTKPVGEKETAPKGEEPLKTNPLAWLAHTAEMFKDEQVQKAKEELTKAKESGDAEEIKRATADMKQAMETKLRGNGIGLVERRRIIGREIGKILGEEAGKAEAEKIDKPWEQMDLEEREAVSSKNPLTETEINELTSEENRELIPAALAYLRGDKGNIINAISYFKIWNDVRSRHENVPDNSGAKDGTQLDAPDTGGSQELGLGRGREGGRPDGPVDRTDGERTTPGERERGTSGENNPSVSAGKPSNDKGEGNTPGMDAVSAGSTDTRGGGRLGNEGNVPKRGGQGGGNGPLDPNAGRKPAAKQGTHFPDSTSERLKQERAEYEQKKKDFWERWKKAGQGYMKISLTPFKALNLSPEQIEMLPELFKMHLNGAVLKIKEGIYKFNEWKAAMRAEEGEELKMIGLSDDDIDRFIEDYWNTPYQMDGETHTIGEWAGIHGNEKLRNKLSEPLNDKYQRQVDAEPIKVKIGDKKNIEETLPYLLPQQQEDVLRAETQFFGNEHADREHAYGKGYMFTNGTGTGKTFTGLGVAKRLVKQGKGRILIVTPSQKKVSDWIKDGRNLNMEIRDLDNWAKERGTTATTESGEGVVITTFANFGVNKKLLETKWDAVIYDESHRIMENKNGTETARSMQHYMVTNRSENHCFLRLQETNKDYQKMKSLGERFDAERGKEVKRIQDEYKASHPSATPRDVAYATSRMLPKERNGFTPGDYASFQKLGKIHAEFVKALSHYTNEVEPKLKAQAKNEWKDTKTIFLSATPFNTRENLDYAEGYIFKYPEVEKGGRISGRTQFYLDHFGAAYKFRYNRLEQSTSNPEAVAKQEIEFSDYLQDTLGTMSGRIIDSPYDYSRDFPTVSPDHAEEFNQAVQDAVRGHGVLADAYRRTIGDYNYGSALFETMKVANIIERIKAHLDAGRKVVIFHRRVETKEPLKPPFAYLLEQANFSIALMKPGEEQKKAIQAVKDFRKKYADLLEWEQTLDYSMPREQIAKVFGKDKVLFFSGKESTKVKDKAVDTFNSDDSGKNIIVIQEASGKEGISLHDTTGKHQRVCITLALPQSPITALQIEGRTYRIGNKSNAIFEYPILGLNSEMMLFGQKFNNQVSTTENLALGSQARSLRDSFANGILEHSGVVPIDQQGVGGKEFDAPKDQSTDGFDNAVLDYYSNQKLNSRNREGVDYFPTPEPLGYKMMEWANMGEGDTVLEPSAGHGAIARYAPKGNQMVAIEPSQSLFTKLQLKAGGLGRKFQNTIFENYDISNKHDVVVMNPPFGTAGATAIAHLGKAFKHLEEGGRVVALIPRGSTDKKFDKWIEGEKTAVMRAEVELPDIVFEQAGTKVVCRVVVVDKISNKAMRAKAGSVEKWDLGGHYDKIEDFFEDLRDVEMPDRIIDTKAIMMKKSKQTVKDLKELKDARVDFNEGGINVRVRGDWKDYSIPFDMEGYNAEQKKKFLASMYETFEQQERQTRNETSQAVLAELKKLTCKLADMTEEEMQRYLKKKYEGKGVMYRIEHAAEVYNKAKGDASLGLSKPTEPLEGRIAETVEKVSKQTGGKVKMVNSVEEIGNEQVRRDIENGKQVTGWYDENTGEVHLYMPNIHDSYTAEKTVWHETVGHEGMRGLLGDKFNDYMRGLWMDLDNPMNAELRAYVKERMSKDSMGFYDAIEEFIAESAEKGKGEPGFWNNIKNKVTDALHEIGYRISPNVKDVKYMLWLAKNVQKKGNDPWWKMRADAVKWKIEHEKTLSVVEENGMMYDNNGKKHGLLDLNKKDFDEATDGRVHYRTSPMAASKIEEYNRRLSTKWYAFRESTVDDMQSLQEAMQIISGVKDAYTDIPSAFNPLLCHNRMGSMVMQMCERYDRECTEPLGDAFKKVVSAMPGKDGAEQTRNANLYFIKKHGLERNRVLFVRDKIREKREGADSEGLDNLDKIWKGERSDLRRKLDLGQIDLREYYRQMDEWIVQNIDKDFKAEEHDYSGMHGIYDVKKGEEYDDANVIDEVMSTESQLGADLVKSFWDAKKKATDFTIDQEYANGFKDKNERVHLKEMFDWYVPLRKFDETVAEDVYGYISGGDTKNEIGSVIEKASGRESLSDVNVLAQISALAKSSIINGGKNVEKQHFMRFVEVYEKGDAKDRIFVEIKPWVEKHTVDGNEVWEEVMPNIPENSTQEQINEILNTFETTMKAKQAKGEAKIARRKSDIGYKFERSSDMNQHIVNVYVNGRVRRFVCQGNPRAAQAINGMLRDSGTQNWVTEKSAKLNRICAQLNTSLNPDFITSNLMRDLTFASANLTKEGMGYTWDFCMEYAKNWGSMVRRKDGSFDGGYLGMFRRYKEGRLDTNNQKERWFKEFMDNGGETGFVSLKKYEDIIKEYENLVKTGNKEGDRWLMKKLKEGGALVELANEVVENVARYSTFCVSRKRGRSIGKSIYDAKEVSSNFNRHGSGDAIKSLKTEYDRKMNVAFRKSLGWFNSYMKNQTMFYNAGVQGANLFAKNIKHAPKTAAIAFGAMPFGLNIAVALLNQLLISQEDEKKRNGVKNPYAELPEWKRRNNLCIYWGGGNFKTIPMGIELRAFYGLGDIAAGYMVDESLKSDTPIGFDVIGQMAQLVPASDFLGHHSPSSGIKESLEDVALSLTPTVAKPELELAFNRNWTGRPIYRDKDYLDRAPRWKSAYDNTNDVYMTINKWANKTFNGIDSTNEDLKGRGMIADAADFFTAPYGLQHIVEGYTGGAGATIGRTYQTGKSLVKGVVSGIKDDKGFKEGFKKEWKNVDSNTIPFYRVFNYTPKEGNDMQRTKSKWYNYANELEQLKYNKRQMKTNTSDVVMNIHNAATKYKLSKTKEGKMLRIYEAADKYITAKNKLLKRAKDQTVINSINEDINRKMQEAVADLDRIED